ncbi:MAG: hypothetical protein K2L98_04830, partial [Bacilli bacterium]|nr:hypothetical protein [Bacilli bacterium]
AWIDEENCRIVFPELPPDRSNPVYDFYQEMFKFFYAKEKKVVTDSKAVSDDAFFFTPCLDKHKYETMEDYHQAKTAKIKAELGKVGIEEPLSIGLLDDGFDSVLPLPFVLKNMESQGGENKYLIKTPEQLELLRRFYRECNNYVRERNTRRANEKWGYDFELEFDEKGHCLDKRCIDSINVPDIQKYMRKNVIMQRYIKTPTKYNTSLRVMIASSGDVLASSLKYALSNEEKEKQREYYDLDDFLADPESPYYLDSESIVSNTVAGGNSILLGREDYTELEREILQDHGIDPDNASVPERILEALKNVTQNCSREIGAICGLDFIYDDEEKNWKYLEEHEFPMLYSYAEKHGIPYDPNDEDFYTVNKLVDAHARLIALKMAMEKKQSLSSGSEGIKIT